MSASSPFPIEGGCDCRAVRYRMETAPLFVHCCHCRWCQRETGSAFALNAMIEADRVALLAGSPELVDTPSASGKGQQVARCPACRIALWSHYSGAGTRISFVRVGTLDDPDALPPVLDLEWNGHSETCPKRVPVAKAREKIAIMLDVMEEHTGKRPIIYTDVAFHREVLEGQLSGYNFWLRSVAAEPHQIYRNRSWIFWQFTTTGAVPGISGPVDRNAFNGSLDEWRQMLPAEPPQRSASGRD